MKAEQCRGARAMLDMTREELAVRSHVAQGTIADFESGRGQPIRSTIEALQRTLEAAGVVFVAENGEGAGVRLRKSGPRDEGLRPEQLTTENDM